MNPFSFVSDYIDSYFRLRTLAECLRLSYRWYESNRSLRGKVHEAILSQQVPQWRAHITRPDFRRNK